MSAAQIAISLCGRKRFSQRVVRLRRDVRNASRMPMPLGCALTTTEFAGAFRDGGAKVQLGASFPPVHENFTAYSCIENIFHAPAGMAEKLHRVAPTGGVAWGLDKNRCNLGRREAKTIASRDNLSIRLQPSDDRRVATKACSLLALPRRRA
jgi:hypothetical protein